ncbi:hypothetical protein KY362_05435 [Candidatus Woesearchaeota archaeon]|nr:hypothetical protein [Candidatus Woesearchaeota archaeon]
MSEDSRDYKGMLIGAGSLAATAAAYAAGLGDIVTEYSGMDRDNVQWCVARTVEASPLLATSLAYVGKAFVERFGDDLRWSNIREFIIDDWTQR